MALTLFLVAGEPSGDALGAALIDGFKTLGPDVRFQGVGGPKMALGGMASLFPYDELAVMGIAEVLPKYRALKRRIAQTAQAFLDSGADALVTIDSPDFGLRVAKIVKAVRPSAHTIHYVAPSVWAWRPGRATKMARVIDHVLALLPFEPPYMQAAGMTCDFVGHPIAGEPPADLCDVAAFRAAFGLSPTDPVVLVLPGSRTSEVTRLAPIFGAALRDIDAKLVVPVTPNVAGSVAELTRKWSPQSLLLNPNDHDPAAFTQLKRGAFAAADVALAASGTVSLELAHARTPMVIAYDMNWLTRQIMRRALQVDTVTLVNLVSETRAVPEFLGDQCRPDAIRAALNTLQDGDARDQLAAMATTMERLGQGGPPPGVRAAQSIVNAVNR